MMFGTRSRIKIYSGILRASIVLGLLAAFVSCDDSEDDDDDNDAAEKPKAKPKPAQADKAEKAGPEPAPTESPIEEERLAYSYNPIGKRDPYKSFITPEVVSAGTTVETPLQKYEIDQYKLVAVITGADEPVAMVEDPKQMGHFLQKDTLIGKNWGKVVRINPTEVIVAEEYRDFEGKLIVNEIPLKLPKERE